MFAKFKRTGEEAVFVNPTLVRDFAAKGEGTVLNFLGGESKEIPFSTSAVRGAFVRAMREHQQNYPVSNSNQENEEAGG